MQKHIPCVFRRVFPAYNYAPEKQDKIHGEIVDRFVCVCALKIDPFLTLLPRAQ